MLKTVVVLDVFVKTDNFFPQDSSTIWKERAIETEIFCKIIKVFSVTFNQFTLSSLNKVK